MRDLWSCCVWRGGGASWGGCCDANVRCDVLRDGFLVGFFVGGVESALSLSSPANFVQVAAFPNYNLGSASTITPRPQITAAVTSTKAVSSPTSTKKKWPKFGVVGVVAVFVLGIAVGVLVTLSASQESTEAGASRLPIPASPPVSTLPPSALPSPPPPPPSPSPLPNPETQIRATEPKPIRNSATEPKPQPNPFQSNLICN